MNEAMVVGYMLTILFAILMLAVFSKLLIFSIKAIWGIRNEICLKE
jgi:hypothetical protein